MKYDSDNTVIYHSADYDGIFCREIAKHFMPEAAFIGWNFGDPKIPMPNTRNVFVLDLNPECIVFGAPEELDRVIWIDHHKSAIDKWPNTINGYRIDGVAACRLAWQWFYLQNGDGVMPRFPKQYEYIERKVCEPEAVRLAGEYDVWDKRDPTAETFQYALRAAPEIDWRKLFDIDNEYFEMILFNGAPAQRYAQNMDADLVKYRSYRMNWEGLNWLVLNTGRFNSLTFAALDKPETGHDALLGYMFNGKCWTVSLYHAKHRADLDLSQIAIKHGGGGHKGACGFTCKTLPFQT